MPISDPFNIPWVVATIQRLQPARVLDVGPGMGVYGVLLRQYLDIAQERITRSSWRVRIDGIEVYESYRNPIWEYFYDRVEIADFRATVSQIESYDVILLCDVLEHFTKQEGLIILDQCLDKARFVVVTTPRFNFPQGEWGGNPNESHLSTWTVSDLATYSCYAKELNDTFIAVLTKDHGSISGNIFSGIPSLVLPRILTPGDICEAILGQRVRLMVRRIRQLVLNSKRVK